MAAEFIKVFFPLFYILYVYFRSETMNLYQLAVPKDDA